MQLLFQLAFQPSVEELKSSMHLILFIFGVFMINIDLKLGFFMGARKTFEIESCSYEIRSDVSRDFLGIPISARDSRAGAQNDIIVNFEE